MRNQAKSEPRRQKRAFIVHYDMGMLSALQGEFTKNDIVTIVARDLPTALLAITQHYFDLAVISSRISEEGDGWAMGGILRLVFPTALLVMITPQTDILSLKSAINNGIDEIFDSERTAQQIVAAMLQSNTAKLASDKIQ